MRIIPLRHKIVDQAQLHYNGMLLDVLNLLQARQNEIDSGRDYIAALRDYWIARTELERAVGGALSERTSQLPPATLPASTRSTPESHEHHHHGE